MRPKLETLITENKNFGTDANNLETGIMINEFNDSIDFIILEFDDRYEVHLNLYDEKPQSRNILAIGIAKSIDKAKKIASQKLVKLAYEN